MLLVDVGVHLEFRGFFLLLFVLFLRFFDFLVVFVVLDLGERRVCGNEGIILAG